MLRYDKEKGGSVLKLSIGTKTLLWGTHQFIVHPLLVLIAFRAFHKRMPDRAELIAILVHDWGYWGKGGIDKDGGENHPYLGAKIAKYFFGERGWNLVIGHSGTTSRKEGVEHSTLYMPDKLSIVLLPGWVHWVMAKLSGEASEYAQKGDGIGFNPWKFKEKIRREMFPGSNKEVHGGSNR